jgi:GNAT superfamily N-acetyltransferase
MGPSAITIIDVIEEAAFGRLPPCADPRFDHRSCDYWEDDVRGAKTARPGWWQTTPASGSAAPSPTRPTSDPFAPRTATRGPNPFAPETSSGLPNPFAPGPAATVMANPFAPEPSSTEANPFAPGPPAGPRVDVGAPRKLQLLGRGLRAFGSYAKVLLIDDRPGAYAQFGPLTAYPRASRIRELYPRLPSAPLPAVITCIATTSEARGHDLARALVAAVRDDLQARGFAAIETYPDMTLGPDEASAALPAFWERCGFYVAIDDERYPVMRLELV